MKLSDFNAIIQILVGFYFAFFGFQLAKRLSDKKYTSFLYKKDSIRNFVESKSQITLLHEDWKKYDRISEYINKFENHFEKSFMIFEEMFIYSGLFGFIVLFTAVFFDKDLGSDNFGNAGLLYFNFFYLVTLFWVFRKLFKKEIEKSSTLLIVGFTTILFIIFLCSILFNNCILFSCLDYAQHGCFVGLTIFSLSLSYFLFYFRWKLNSYILFREIDSIEKLIAEFTDSSQEYINEKIIK